MGVIRVHVWSLGLEAWGSLFIKLYGAVNELIKASILSHLNLKTLNPKL